MQHLRLTATLCLSATSAADARIDWTTRITARQPHLPSKHSGGILQPRTRARVYHDALPSRRGSSIASHGAYLPKCVAAHSQAPTGGGLQLLKRRHTSRLLAPERACRASSLFLPLLQRGCATLCSLQHSRRFFGRTGRQHHGRTERRRHLQRNIMHLVVSRSPAITCERPCAARAPFRQLDKTFYAHRHLNVTRCCLRLLGACILPLSPLPTL